MHLPKHIAIIMDGNGRWARERNLPRTMGHREGAKTVDNIIELCASKGIKALTLYSFSTENWKRAKDEVAALMNLLERGIRDNIKKMLANDIRFNAIGRIHELPEGLQQAIGKAAEATKDNKRMTVSLAINYGGRQEILDAAKKLASEKSDDVSAWTEEMLAGCLYTNWLPDPDLVIRTSGEMRTSNFLLWQTAYAEYYITDTLWPDFDEDELDKALKVFADRERRYGG